MMYALIKRSVMSVTKSSLYPMVLTDGEETLADLDETLALLAVDLKTDEYGNRMNWKKREELIWNIDNLLDARLDLMNSVRAVKN